MKLTLIVFALGIFLLAAGDKILAFLMGKRTKVNKLDARNHSHLDETRTKIDHIFNRPRR